MGPRKRQPFSLKKACLLNISDNMDTFWCTHKTRADLAQDNFDLVLGPFDCLFPNDMTSLLNILCHQQKLKPPHLDLLLTNTITHLHLASCDSRIVNNDRVILKVAKRCVRLKHLDASGLNKVTISSWVRLIPSLNFAKVINLSRTKCNDHVIESIIQTCSKLQELLLEGCPVSDAIASHLCQENHKERFTKLDLYHTKISFECARKLFRFLPNLVDFKHSYWQDMFSVLMLEEGNSYFSYGEKSRLQVLSLHDHENHETMSTNVMKTVAECCPYICDLSLTTSITSQTLFDAVALHHLAHLTLGAMNNPPNEYREGFVKLLEKQGVKLISLSLADMKIDVHLVGKFCPRLRNFSLVMHNPSTHEMGEEMEVAMEHWLEDAESSHMFTQGETVVVDLADGLRLHCDCCLDALLSNSEQLTKVAIHCEGPPLNDDLLNKYINLGCLDSVHNLSITRSKTVTCQPFFNFLNTKTLWLEQLDISHCSEITRQQFSQLQKHAKVKGYSKLKIVWR